MNLEPHFSHPGSATQPQSPASDHNQPPRAAPADEHRTTALAPGLILHALGLLAGSAELLRSAALSGASQRPTGQEKQVANEARITRRWPDGDTLYVTCVADSAYPDALDEARVNATRLYAEALGVTLTAVVEDDGDTV